jgi:segregation and condensation protein A
LEQEWQIKIDAFEGPLDLLLHLIQKNKLDILDIPISIITSQYLEHLKLMKAHNMVVAGEYLLMAAILLHIKSRMVLRAPELEEDMEDDPRMLIVRPLQELLRMREAAKALNERPILGKDVFVRPIGSDEKEDDSLSDTVIEASISQLLSAFQKVIKGEIIPSPLEIRKSKQSVSEWMEKIVLRLQQGKKISFFELLSGKDREVTVVVFLALLELTKLGKIRLFQKISREDILITCKPLQDTASALLSASKNSNHLSPAVPDEM